MTKIPLTPELFGDKPIFWMDDVGPVVHVGDNLFCCEIDSEGEQPDIYVWIYEKPDVLPDDPDESIPKTLLVGKRIFQNENSMLHIQNFIQKFAKDENYRKAFLIDPQ